MVISQASSIASTWENVGNPDLNNSSVPGLVFMLIEVWEALPLVFCTQVYICTLCTQISQEKQFYCNIDSSNLIHPHVTGGY